MTATNPISIENPLRRPADLFLRYTIYTFVETIIVAMSVHLLVLGTDWGRMGSPSEIMETAISLLPNLGYIPQIISPLLDTALMAFWGTLLAVVRSIPVSYLESS